MDCGNVILGDSEPPIVKPLYLECKFTVSSSNGTGGDFERNFGGDVGEKRVTFEGYASDELIGALVDAIGKTVD